MQIYDFKGINQNDRDNFTWYFCFTHRLAILATKKDLMEYVSTNPVMWSHKTSATVESSAQSKKL